MLVLVLLVLLVVLLLLVLLVLDARAENANGQCLGVSNPRASEWNNAPLMHIFHFVLNHATPVVQLCAWLRATTPNMQPPAALPGWLSTANILPF